MCGEPVTFGDVVDLIQPTVAHESTVGSDQCEFLSHERLLKFGHLRNMISIGTEFIGTDALVDAREIVDSEILTILNS